MYRSRQLSSTVLLSLRAKMVTALSYLIGVLDRTQKYFTSPETLGFLGRKETGQNQGKTLRLSIVKFSVYYRVIFNKPMFC